MPGVPPGRNYDLRRDGLGGARPSDASRVGAPFVRGVTQQQRFCYDQGKDTRSYSSVVTICSSTSASTEPRERRTNGRTTSATSNMPERAMAAVRSSRKSQSSAYATYVP